MPQDLIRHLRCVEQARVNELSCGPSEDVTLTSRMCRQWRFDQRSCLVESLGPSARPRGPRRRACLASGAAPAPPDRHVRQLHHPMPHGRVAITDLAGPAGPRTRPGPDVSWLRGAAPPGPVDRPGDRRDVTGRDHHLRRDQHIRAGHGQRPVVRAGDPRLHRDDPGHLPGRAHAGHLANRVPEPGGDSGWRKPDPGADARACRRGRAPAALPR
jgi:hypothetical protein